MELIKITDRISYLPGEQRTDRPLLYYIRGTVTAWRWMRAIPGRMWSCFTAP